MGWVTLRGENELFHPPSCTLYSISIFFLIYFTSINSSIFLLLILISLLYDTNKWHLHSRHLGIRLKRQGVWHGEYADRRCVWQIFLLRLLSPAPELLYRSEIQTPIDLAESPCLWSSLTSNLRTEIFLVSYQLQLWNINKKCWFCACMWLCAYVHASFPHQPNILEFSFL